MNNQGARGPTDNNDDAQLGKTGRNSGGVDDINNDDSEEASGDNEEQGVGGANGLGPCPVQNGSEDLNVDGIPEEAADNMTGGALPENPGTASGEAIVPLIPLRMP